MDLTAKFSGFSREIADVVSTRELVKDEDFQVVSMVVIDEARNILKRRLLPSIQTPERSKTRVALRGVSYGLIS